MPRKSTARKSRPAPSPEAFLAQYPPETRALAEQLRTLVRQAVPAAIEAVYPGWKLIGYRRPASGGTVYFGFVAPQPGAVVLGFEYGVLLDDPGGLLEGRGTQVRQVALHPGEALQHERLLTLVQQAAEVAGLTRDEKARRMLALAAARELRPPEA